MAFSARPRRISGFVCLFLFMCILYTFSNTQVIFREQKETLEFRGRNKFSNRLSILRKASVRDVQLYPFPHLIIRNALPKDLYNTLAKNFPSDSSFGSKRQVLLNNRRMNIPAQKYLKLNEVRNAKLWKSFISYHVSEEFVSEVLELFGASLRRFRPDFLFDIGARNASLHNFSMATRNTPEALKADLVLDCQVGINTPVSSKSVVRGPHTDNPNEIWAGLLYFKHEGDKSKDSSGALEIWDCQNSCERIPNEDLRRKRSLGLSLIPNHDQFDKQELLKILSVPYKANTLVFFINSPLSIHSVSPRDKSRYSRRLVNFIADKRKSSVVITDNDCKAKHPAYGCSLDL